MILYLYHLGHPSLTSPLNDINYIENNMLGYCYFNNFIIQNRTGAVAKSDYYLKHFQMLLITQDYRE